MLHIVAFKTSQEIQLTNEKKFQLNYCKARQILKKL